MNEVLSWKYTKQRKKKEVRNKNFTDVSYQGWIILQQVPSL